MSIKKINFKSIGARLLAVIMGASLLTTPVEVFANDFGYHNKPSKPDEEVTVTSVDHIDIGIDLMATIVINGEATQAEFTIGTEDAQYVTITAHPSDTEFRISGGVSTSTDNQGNKQIRIEGDFPVGTSDAPVSYTVTLSKTITTSNGVEVPVTLSTSTHYWDTANVCPGFQQNPGKQSGIDLKLNNGAGSSNTKGTLQIQKTLSGATPENDTIYSFRILDEAGNIYIDNVEIKIPAGHNTASIILTNLDFGSYTVEEISSYAEMNGTILSELRYEPANTFSLAADSHDSAVNVTSTYVMPEPEKYTIQFADFNGNIISSNEYEEGAAIIIPENPERVSEEPEKYNWIFTGWDKDISTIANGNVVYIATYKKVNVTYSVSFVDWDDSIISQVDYFYGDYPAIPENPAHENTAEATYEFLNWDKEVKPVSEDVIYKAVYTETKIIPKYIIEFRDWDNTIISRKIYEEGDFIDIPSNPVRSADNTYIYEFAGWDNEVSNTAVSDAIYTATYNAVYDENDASCSDTIEQTNNNGSKTDNAESETENQNEEILYDCENLADIQCKAPQTGDSSSVSVYMILLMISAIFIVLSSCCVIYTKKLGM